MILDKILLKNINIVGKQLLNDSNLTGYPKDIDEMNTYLQTLKKCIEKEEFSGILIGNILYSFVSDIDVRDRNTTSRIFEDIFASLFNEKSTDIGKRSNPKITKEILSYDNFCNETNWKISNDLSGNKREKSDLSLGNYHISLKTLKGKAYNQFNQVIDNKLNGELNIGSLSYRALLKGVISDRDLDLIGDRKKGLGSGSQLRENVFDKILKYNGQEKFIKRLYHFLEYVYEEDIYIVLKSHYQMKFYLIPNKSFINTIVDTYKNDEKNFQSVFYRWENNNLRLNWQKLIQKMDTYGHSYKEINLDFSKCVDNPDFNEFKKKLDLSIESYLSLYTSNR